MSIYYFYLIKHTCVDHTPYPVRIAFHFFFFLVCGFSYYNKIRFQSYPVISFIIFHVHLRNVKQYQLEFIFATEHVLVQRRAALVFPFHIPILWKRHFSITFYINGSRLKTVFLKPKKK